MEALVQRIRLVMNLILVSSLLLALGLNAEQHDVTGAVTEIFDHAFILESIVPDGRPLPVLENIPKSFREIKGIERLSYGALSTDLLEVFVNADVRKLKSPIRSRIACVWP